jgi:hypothetical protein
VRRLCPQSERARRGFRALSMDRPMEGLTKWLLTIENIAPQSADYQHLI